MKYRIIRDTLFNNTFVRKGEVVDVPNAKLATRHMEPLETAPTAEELNRELIIPTQDELDEMTRAELVKLANAEGYSMPDGIRLRGDMVGAIRKFRASKGG